MTLPYIPTTEWGALTRYIPDVPRHAAQHAPYVAQQVTQAAASIPVPEFSSIALVAFSALAASLYLLRRRRR